jgi:4-methylaminobutanoate oxidase (formaldehyde-forming)
MRGSARKPAGRRLARHRQPAPRVIANRWQELKRSATIAKSIGFDMQLLPRSEAFDSFPLFDLDGVVGAAFVPSDGYVDPYGLTQAYAKGARAGGVRSSKASR